MDRVITKIGKDIVVTPTATAIKLIELLPDDVWNSETKFIDPCCKSGILLLKIKERLVNECQDLIDKFPDRYDRIKHVEDNQLYGICWNKQCLDESRNQVYGSAYVTGNIVLVENMLAKLKEKESSNNYKKIIREAFKIMQFDVIVGNPPYNNDIYTKFVMGLQGMYTKYMCMITPAKWQAKCGVLNDEFRKQVVPYMSKVVYYPDAFELFDIREQEGITYFLVDTSRHDKKDIKVVCGKNSALESDETGRTNILQTLYGSEISSIIDKCLISKSISSIIGVKQSEYVQNTDSGKEIGNIPIYAGEKIVGNTFKENLKSAVKLDKYKVSTSVMPVDVGFDKNGQMFGLSRTYIVPPNAVPKGSFPVLMKFDTEGEAKSFQSYCNTRLIRFLYFIGICGKTISEEFWRFIPIQSNWDELYTDDALYKQYNISDNEILIIESVIKARA